jgi:CHASE3 domain sensor protein
MLEQYQKCVNQIDDFLEYRYKGLSGQEVRDQVISIIEKMCEAILKEQKEKGTI